MNIGDDTPEKFLGQVLAAATICRQHLANKIPMKRLTLEQWSEYHNVTKCLICAKPFKSADKKVCNHDHLTGEERSSSQRMQLELPHRSEEIENSMHYSQPQRYIFSALSLFSQLLVFETFFDSYFYDSHFDSYFYKFYEFCKFHFVAILYVFCKLSFYVVSAFF